MRKIIPILAISSIGLLLNGCSGQMNTNNLKDNVDTFFTSVQDYLNTTETPTITTLNKYVVSVEDNLDNEEDTTPNAIEDQEISPEDDSIEEYESDQKIINEDNTISDNILDSDENESSNRISTLYSLSSDIEESCNEFCRLKEDITDAILETENLLLKIQNKDIELTTEQKIFLLEQSNQLKTLARELNKTTNELSFQLTDLSNLQLTNTDPDTLSLRYLMVLSNLMNGNDLLSNSLMSLRMLNNISYLNQMNGMDNNSAKILYGFQRNDEPPVIKEYVINQDGEISENSMEVESDTNEQDNEQDSYTTNSTTDLKSNIDTYGTNYKNIDTFFNTALLDNEFMYGAGGYPMNGMYGMNPYMNQYNQYAHQNQQIINDNSANNDIKNNNIEENEQKNDKIEQKRVKKSKFSKNIDTYRNENTPDLKSRISNIKSSIKGFFSKISPNKDNIKNPLYRETED